MSRILIWRYPAVKDGLDIFDKSGQNNIWNEVYIANNIRDLNWGNKLWFQAIYSEIQAPDNSIVFRQNETIDEINNEFDCIIYPQANFFSEEYCMDTSSIVNSLSGIRIPVYVIAVGAQAKSYSCLEHLVSKIGTQASKYIEAIYKTGGEFALRGYFTKEFFDRLGFHSAVVTGCPSLYQLGRNLKIHRKIKEIKPIVNGRIEYFETILQFYKNSCYFSQDRFAEYLLNNKWFKELRFVDALRTYYHIPKSLPKLLFQGRIKLFTSMNLWYNFIRNEKFNYSIGTKIHGSIMPLLAGIPATVCAIDSRTQEMAEFFDIPMVNFQNRELRKKLTFDEFNDICRDADYQSFNHNFEKKYDKFESFLREHKIVDVINTDNQFLYDISNQHNPIR